MKSRKTAAIILTALPLLLLGAALLLRIAYGLKTDMMTEPKPFDDGRELISVAAIMLYGYLGLPCAIAALIMSRAEVLRGGWLFVRIASIVEVITCGLIVIITIVPIASLIIDRFFKNA